MRNTARNTGNIKSRQRIKFPTPLVLRSNAPPQVRCGPSNSPLPGQGRGSNAWGMPGVCPGGGGGGMCEFRIDRNIKLFWNREGCNSRPNTLLMMPLMCKERLIYCSHSTIVMLKHCDLIVTDVISNIYAWNTIHSPRTKLPCSSFCNMYKCIALRIMMLFFPTETSELPGAILWKWEEVPSAVAWWHWLLLVSYLRLRGQANTQITL